MEPLAQAIRSQVQQSAVVGYDEVGARLDCHVWREWVFVRTETIYHVISQIRGMDVIQSVMASATVEIWVGDYWKPQTIARISPDIHWSVSHLSRKASARRERSAGLITAVEAGEHGPTLTA